MPKPFGTQRVQSWLYVIINPAIAQVAWEKLRVDEVGWVCGKELLDSMSPIGADNAPGEWEYDYESARWHILRDFLCAVEEAGDGAASLKRLVADMERHDALVREKSDLRTFGALGISLLASLQAQSFRWCNTYAIPAAPFRGMGA